MSVVEVSNEGLRSSLTRSAFRQLLALGQQLAPPAATMPNASSCAASQASAVERPPTVDVLDQVDEDAFRQCAPPLLLLYQIWISASWLPLSSGLA